MSESSEMLPYKLYKRLVVISKKAGVFIPRPKIKEVGEAIKRLSNAEAVEYLERLSDEMGWSDERASDEVRQKLHDKGIFAGKMFGTLCEIAKKGVNIDFMIKDLENSPENLEKKLKEEKYKELLGWDEISPSLLKYLDSLDPVSLEKFAREVYMQKFPHADETQPSTINEPIEAEAGRRSRVPFALSSLPPNHATQRKATRMNRKQGKSSSLAEDEEQHFESD